MSPAGRSPGNGEPTAKSLASLIGTEVLHTLGRDGIDAIVAEQGPDAFRRHVARAQGRWLVSTGPFSALYFLNFN